MEWDNHDATYMLGIGLALMLSTVIKNFNVLTFAAILLFTRGVMGIILTFRNSKQRGKKE